MRSGSISRVLCHYLLQIMVITIPLDMPLLAASSSLPEATREPRLTTPYLALLRMGFTYACTRYRIQRCALTTPFHPDHRKRWRSSLCGTFLGFPPLDVIQHPVLCSPDFPRYASTYRDYPNHSARQSL